MNVGVEFKEIDKIKVVICLYNHYKDSNHLFMASELLRKLRNLEETRYGKREITKLLL